MTMKKMLKRHVNKIIICVPALRDADNRPKSFKVLNTCIHADEACDILARYEAEGADYANVIAIPNFPEELNNGIAPELPPNIIAKMFRVLYGMQ